MYCKNTNAMMKYSNVSLILFFYVLVLFFVLTVQTQSIDVEEDRELERQLKILNKKPIKTITTEYGDTIDCINIYKQSAFDHPLLKHHKIQMVPSSIPEEKTSSNNISSSIFRRPEIDTGLQNERCPPGSVPLRRTTKEELVHARYLLQQKNNSIHTNRYTQSPMYYHFVSVEEENKEGKPYFGSVAWMSVHGFELNHDQITTAQIWIQNGPPENINSIEVGWFIYPELSGNSFTRTFGYWTADGSNQTGCFNMFCPGFVQVSNRSYLGQQILPLSEEYGGKVFVMTYKVFRDPKTGNWWFVSNDEAIGYWPKELFTHLADNASIMRYGGIAGNKLQAPAPPMGNTYLPQLQDYSKTAFMMRLQYVDEKGEAVKINQDNIQTKRNTTLDEYDILFAGNIGGEYGVTMAYGGPGAYVSGEPPAG